MAWEYDRLAACITGYVVLLLYLANAPAPATATWRAIDTIFGGALALVIYRLWPTWESSQVRELLAVQVEALARDADALLGAYVDPSTWDPKILQQTRAAARLARSNVDFRWSGCCASRSSAIASTATLRSACSPRFAASRSARWRCTPA